MTEQQNERRLPGWRFGIRIAAFVLIALLLLGYAAYVLTPKFDYGICSMLNFYRQERDSIDVLAVGTSMVYSGVNTNVLWREYGIAAYDLCSAEQPFWVSYYVIREVLKYQHPKVILLDAQPSIYTRDYSKRGRTILSTYGILGLKNRVGAIQACVEKPADAVGYLLALPEVHSNYKTVTTDDFAFPPSNGGRGANWKGFIESDEVESHERPGFVWTNVKRNMNEREEYYARMIFELCWEEGVQIMLLGMPTPDYANDHGYYTSLWAIAGEYGITGINYNHPDLRYGLRYSSDFADWQHLNVKGSITFSKKLGEDLKSLYELPDRRGDPAYESYEICAEEWYGKLPTFDSSGLKQEEEE